MNDVLIENVIETFKTKALKEIPSGIKNIYLFGSCARGTYKDESDIDVFVVVDTSVYTLREYRDKLLEITSEINIDNNVFISPIVSDKVEWDKNKDFSLLYRNILSEGIQSYG